MRLTGLLGAAVVTAALAVPVTAAPASAALPGCDATEAQIYAPPATVTGNPGDILACKPTELPVITGAPASKAYKVQYVTTNALGQKVATSGAIAVPTAAWTKGGSRPTLAYAPFTHGSGSQCSASKQLSGGFQDAFEGFLLGDYLKAGYGVVIADGVGYLDGQVHHYTNGLSNGPALLDVVRAARNLPENKLAADSKVLINGYSEGGNTSLWAGQLAASYAPDLNVVGVASGGIPADLKAAAKHLNGGPFAGFLADALVGLREAYPDMPFDSYMNDTGRKAIADVKAHCTIGTVATFALAKVENFSTDKLTLDQLYAIQGPGGVTWGQIADSQKLGVDIGTPASNAKWKIGFPVYQYRGFFEEILPTPAMDAVANAYCKAGVPTQYNGSVWGEHALSLFTGNADVQKFFADRLDGKPFSPMKC